MRAPESTPGMREAVAGAAMKRVAIVYCTY